LGLSWGWLGVRERKGGHEVETIAVLDAT